MTFGYVIKLNAILFLFSTSQCPKKCDIALYLFILGRELLQLGGQQ